MSPIRFSSRADFAGHLAQHKYIKIWVCTTCGEESCDRFTLQQHVMHSHQLIGEGEDNVQIKEKSVLRDISSQKCPFCDEIPGITSFVGHICHHLEEISFSAIAQEDVDSEEEAEESVSGSAISANTYFRKAVGVDMTADEEEEELERQIREMEEAEADRERLAAEIQAKRAADKFAAEKARDERRIKEIEENDRKLKEQEREMERLEEERERRRAELKFGGG